MTDFSSRFIYLIDRLQRAGARHSAAVSDEERRQAQRWLVLRNRSVQQEHARSQGRADDSDTTGRPGAAQT